MDPQWQPSASQISTTRISPRGVHQFTNAIPRPNTYMMKTTVVRVYTRPPGSSPDTDASRAGEFPLEVPNDAENRGENSEAANKEGGLTTEEVDHAATQLRDSNTTAMHLRWRSGLSRSRVSRECRLPCHRRRARFSSQSQHTKHGGLTSPMDSLANSDGSASRPYIDEELAESGGKLTKALGTVHAWSSSTASSFTQSWANSVRVLRQLSPVSSEGSWASAQRRVHCRGGPETLAIALRPTGQPTP